MAPILRTHVDPRSELFRDQPGGPAGRAGRDRGALRPADRRWRHRGPRQEPHTVDRHRARGKLLARERIELLLDRAAFLELSPLAGWGTDVPVGAGLVSGIGRVDGRRVRDHRQRADGEGRLASPITVTKALRAMEIARQNRLPIINLTESGGADLPKQVEVFVAGGAAFRNLTRRSAAGIPTICLVFGSSTAGGAYVPGHERLRRDGQGRRRRCSSAGPPLVKMAIGEDADDETLGGAEMHARDVRASPTTSPRDERDAIRIGREIVAHLNWRKAGPGRRCPVEPPLYDPEELLGIASPDIKVPFDVARGHRPHRRRLAVRRVQAALRHDARVRLGPRPRLPGRHPRQQRHPLLARRRRRARSSSSCATRPTCRSCSCRTSPASWSARRYEQGGIIKDGAKLINAVSNSTVPTITVMIGASLRRRQLRHVGRAYDPRFVFTWPNHRIAVMGPKQLAGVLVDRAAPARPKRRGRPSTSRSRHDARCRSSSRSRGESTAFFATGAPLGRRHHRPARHAHRARRSRSRPCTPAPFEGTRLASASSGCDGR